MCRSACLYTESPVFRRKHIDTRCMYHQCYIIRQADGSFLICGDIETVAGCYGDTLAFDPEEWQKIVEFFTRTGRKTTPNNRKQAMVPVLGHKVVNHPGTAPGAWFEQDGRCAVLMPGVPHEMKAMWEESIRPLLLARQNCALHSLTLRVLGGESNLEYRVRALLEYSYPSVSMLC